MDIPENKLLREIWTKTISFVKWSGWGSPSSIFYAPKNFYTYAVITSTMLLSQRPFPRPTTRNPQNLLILRCTGRFFQTLYTEITIMLSFIPDIIIKNKKHWWSLTVCRRRVKHCSELWKEIDAMHMVSNSLSKLHNLIHSWWLLFWPFADGISLHVVSM